MAVLLWAQIYRLQDCGTITRSGRFFSDCSFVGLGDFGGPDLFRGTRLPPGVVVVGITLGGVVLKGLALRGDFQNARSARSSNEIE